MSDIRNIIDSNNIEKLKMLACTAEDMLETIEKLDENKYAKYELDIYEISNGKKISEEIAMNWVASMKPVGMHWTMDETTSAMRDRGWNLDPVEFFVVANMIFNDYNDLIADDAEMTLKMAKDWLQDVDSKENKLYNYYKYVI